MTLEEIWGALLCKKPNLKNPDAEVLFQAKSLKKLLQQVYDKGVAAEAGRRDHADKIRQTLDDACKKPGSRGAFEDLFGSGFGF